MDDLIDRTWIKETLAAHPEYQSGVADYLRREIEKMKLKASREYCHCWKCGKTLRKKAAIFYKTKPICLRCFDPEFHQLLKGIEL